MKQCSLCKQTKPKTEFTKHSQKSDGLNSWCKVCKREKDKQAAAKRKPLKAEYDKVYCQINKDKIQNRSSLYRAVHKEEKAQYDKAYRIAQGQLRLAKKRDYYYATGKAVQYIWIKNNPNKIKAYSSTTCAKRRSVISTGDSSKVIQTWLKQQTLICTYCGTYCAHNYHIDHIEPLSKGGTHTINNFTIACPSCNSSKSSKHLIYWLATKIQTDRN